ncbi:MAG TPA: F0F1 ATP synthase subunit B [Nocardioides sp.]|nr:F0F1 ATP synthase subunit B [Nocardioides sp.]
MSIVGSTAVTPLASNFLVPNATFLVELLAFAIMVWIFGKYLIPPINKAMSERQAAVRRQFAELDEAKADARKAEADYKEQLNNAKHEAARIREEAREHGAQIVQEAREKAQTEADRIIEHAHVQIEADRKTAFASLRRDVGSLATTLAGRIVGESMDDDERQGRVVERFLADLEETG